ncbi:MAG: ATP-dependent Clp protease adapter ClpS [Desulfovibrio sp.]|nr:ATP-dependent Clp protease adapter ClpS [Desulfovibrio sp.]
MPRTSTLGVEGDTEVVVATKLKEPERYRVFLHNDDYTTMEFVVEILQQVFHKPVEEATKIMMHVHQNGRGECGIFTYEIAETKVASVHSLARKAGFPLKCTMEKV